MKYTYAYKTSDGTRHEAAIEAPSRDEAFAALRKRGIKPIKVVAADGSKANGELRGIRKRVAAIVTLIVSVVVGIAAYMAGRDVPAPAEPQSTETASPRHQIYGDPVVVGEMEHGRFETYLPREGDRLLAWFAQPGRFCCPKSTSWKDLARLSETNEVHIKAVADSDVELSEGDLREVRELKQIVNGMRREMREYLANGNGTLRSYWRRLVERTTQEAQIYERIKRELENITDQSVWERQNAALQRLGLRTIPNPNDVE